MSFGKSISIALVCFLATGAAHGSSVGALDRGNGQNEVGDQNDKTDGKKNDDQKSENDQNKKPPMNNQDSEWMRVDCRYHNVENISGIGFCYASSVYKVTEHGFGRAHLGVGCDQHTVYNDQGRIHKEQLGERISPPTSAFPAVEISPEGSLRSPGTYESVLDIRVGRLSGTCYVHKVIFDNY